MLIASLDSATWALVGVTAALVVVTGVLAISTWRSSSKTAEAARAAVRAAEAAEQDLKQGQELIRIGQEQVTTSHDQTEAALRQADVAQRALAANVQPLLLPVVSRQATVRLLNGVDGQLVETELGPEPRILRQIQGGQRRFWLVVPIRNVGQGPAIFGPEPTDVSMRPFYAGATNMPGRPGSPIIAPGDVVDVVFTAPEYDILGYILDSPPTATKQAEVTLSYFDIARVRKTTTIVDLSGAPGPLLRVSNVELAGWQP